MLAVFALTSACAPDLTCEDPQPYQSAIEVDKVDSPDGLDDLQASEEMAIPRASPRDARQTGDPCLDLPPTIQAEDSD